MNGKILFETKVTPREGSPYLATKKNKVQLLVTTEEIRFNDPLWTFAIPLHRIIDCIAKPLTLKKAVASTWSAPSTVEYMDNCLVIDYLDEHEQRRSMLSIFAQHYFIKSNVADTIRFNKTVEMYHLRDKFVREPVTDPVQNQPD